MAGDPTAGRYDSDANEIDALAGDFEGQYAQQRALDTLVLSQYLQTHVVDVTKPKSGAKGKSAVIPIKPVGSGFCARVANEDISFLTSPFFLRVNAPKADQEKKASDLEAGLQGIGRHSRGEESPGATAYHVSKVAIRSFTEGVAAEERDYNICIMAMGPGGEELNDPRRGVATAESPDETKGNMRPVEDVVSNRFIIAAEAPMEFSGHMVNIRNGKVVLAPDEQA